jgi:hypothetical protein
MRPEKSSPRRHFPGGEFTTEAQRAQRFLLGGPEGTLFDGSDLVRLFALQIRPSAGNYHEQAPNFPSALNAHNPSQQIFFSPADLGVLCVSVVKPSRARRFVMGDRIEAFSPTCKHCCSTCRLNCPVEAPAGARLGVLNR